MGSINVKRRDASLEIYARIIKATARKYDCGMRIEHSDDGMKTKFVGDDELLPHILEEVEAMFGESVG